MTNKFRNINAERRRMSMAPSGGIFQHRRSVDPSQNTRHYKMENTYRTDPSADNCLNLTKIRLEIEQLLRSTIGQKRYVQDTCQLMCLLLTNQIKALAREQIVAGERHKIVCIVLINERREQGISMASRCLWNDSTDNSVNVTYQNDSISAVALVNFVYYE